MMSLRLIVKENREKKKCLIQQFLRKGSIRNNKKYVWVMKTQ